MAHRKPKKAAEQNVYYILDNRVIQQVSIDLPARLLAKVPWVISSTAKMKSVIKMVEESALGSALVVDTELGRPIFAVTKSEEVAVQCAKKKKKKKALKGAFSACKAKCKAELPNCGNILVIISSKGVCSCGCLDDVLDISAEDFFD